MAGKRHCSLCCAPQPLARFIQLFPKLAVVFFVIHITVIIYSFFNPSPHAVKSSDVPPGVVDDKMKLVETDHRIHTNKNASEGIVLRPNNGALGKGSQTKSLLLQKLKPAGFHDNKDRENSNIQVNHHKRSAGS